MAVKMRIRPKKKRLTWSVMIATRYQQNTKLCMLRIMEGLPVSFDFIFAARWYA